MGIIARVRGALQSLLGPCAEQAAQESGVIVRQRKFTPLSLARTFVLGFLHKPTASDEDLAQIAVQCGAAVTPQAIDQRHTPALVRFLESLFRQGVRLVVGADTALAPLLERFTTVTLLDSSTITLPDSLQEEYPGCGGGRGGGAAGMKLQTELDLRSGALLHVEIEAARCPDGATARQQAARPAGSLRITDLGYFNVAVFAAMAVAGVHFLSRLQFGTAVRRTTGVRVDILAWLQQQVGPFVDQSIQLGASEGLACRLLAWRVPAEQAERRRRKLRQETLRKRGQQPSAARLAWCDWTILVTSVPEALLSPPEAVILYRARWQVEMCHPDYPSSNQLYHVRRAA